MSATIQDIDRAVPSFGTPNRERLNKVLKNLRGSSSGVSMEFFGAKPDDPTSDDTQAFLNMFEYLEENAQTDAGAVNGARGILLSANGPLIRVNPGIYTFDGGAGHKFRNTKTFAMIGDGPGLSVIRNLSNDYLFEFDDQSRVLTNIDLHNFKHIGGRGLLFSSKRNLGNVGGGLRATGLQIVGNTNVALGSATNSTDKWVVHNNVFEGAEEGSSSSELPIGLYLPAQTATIPVHSNIFIRQAYSIKLADGSHNQYMIGPSNSFYRTRESSTDPVDKRADIWITPQEDAINDGLGLKIFGNRFSNEGYGQDENNMPVAGEPKILVAHEDVTNTRVDERPHTTATPATVNAQSADGSTNRIVANAHGIKTGETVRVTPQAAGLSAAGGYFARAVDENTITLHGTQWSAENNEGIVSLTTTATAFTLEQHTGSVRGVEVENNYFQGGNNPLTDNAGIIRLHTHKGGGWRYKGNIQTGWYPYIFEFVENVPADLLQWGWHTNDIELRADSFEHSVYQGAVSSRAIGGVRCNVPGWQTGATGEIGAESNALLPTVELHNQTLSSTSKGASVTFSSATDIRGGNNAGTFTFGADQVVVLGIDKSAVVPGLPIFVEFWMKRAASNSLEHIQFEMLRTNSNGANTTRRTLEVTPQLRRVRLSFMPPEAPGADTLTFQLAPRLFLSAGVTDSVYLDGYRVYQAEGPMGYDNYTFPGGGWNDGHLVMNGAHLWSDGSDFRFDSAAPTASDSGSKIAGMSTHNWTPTVFGLTTAGTQTYNSDQTYGRATKIGNTVIGNLKVHLTAIDAATDGAIAISLPSSISVSNTTLRGGVSVANHSGVTLASGKTLMGLLDPAANRIVLKQVDNTTPVNLARTNLSSSTVIELSFTYLTSP